MNPKVAVVIGTRPCIIKQFSPYINLKKNPNLSTLLIHSGQHDLMGVQAQQSFNLIPDYTCRVIPEDKFRLGILVSRLISEFTTLFYELKPDMVLVHGDTSTAFAAAEAAFLQNITIGHVEAGLRTSRFETPFPEEGYRRQISRIATLHFAPTSRSAENLYGEGIKNGIHIVGNSIVDALQYILAKEESENVKNLKTWLGDSRYAIVTCHRRESYGDNLVNLCSALKTIVNENRNVKILWPVHSNPNINDIVYKILWDYNQIQLIEPLEYSDFAKLLKGTNLVITDSGGVVEECAVLGIPTLILREETERPEALSLDCVRLIGYDFEELIDLASIWLSVVNVKQIGYNNTFGDGSTGIEIAEIIDNYFKEKKV